VDGGQGRHYLFDARIDTPRIGVDLYQPRDLVLIPNGIERIDGQIQTGASGGAAMR